MLFNDENNRKYLLNIFEDNKIEKFIKKYRDREDLATIRDYYNMYFFESKKNDIAKIVNFLKYNKKLKDHEIKKYQKEMEKAKEMLNPKYQIIISLYIWFHQSIKK